MKALIRGTAKDGSALVAKSYNLNSICLEEAIERFLGEIEKPKKIIIELEPSRPFDWPLAETYI